MQISIANSCKCGNGPVDACYVASPQWFIPEVRQHRPQPGLWFLALWMPCRKQVVRTGRAVTNENCHLHHSCNYQGYLNCLHFYSMRLIEVSIIIETETRTTSHQYAITHWLTILVWCNIAGHNPFPSGVIILMSSLSWYLICDSMVLLLWCSHLP